MTTWYKKRTDAKAKWFAVKTMCHNEFAALGDVIHKDDMKDVFEFLGFSDESLFWAVVARLFEPTELSHGLQTS